MITTKLTGVMGDWLALPDWAGSIISLNVGF